MTAASVTANVCMVIGTPIGIGMDICAIIAVTAVHRLIVQISLSLIHI